MQLHSKDANGDGGAPRGFLDSGPGVGGVDGGYDDNREVTGRGLTDQGGDCDIGQRYDNRGQGYDDMGLGGNDNDYAPHMPQEEQDMDIAGIDSVINPSRLHHIPLPSPHAVKAVSPVVTVPSRVHPLHLRWDDDDNGGEADGPCYEGKKCHTMLYILFCSR